jgi:hypothetical protein
MGREQDQKLCKHLLNEEVHDGQMTASQDKYAKLYRLDICKSMLKEPSKPQATSSGGFGGGDTRFTVSLEAWPNLTAFMVDVPIRRYARRTAPHYRFA